jgi:SAM-dependent methyltransferase
MLDIKTYRTSERLASTALTNWRVAAAHNLAHFEKAGFPVRINSLPELRPLLDTMQENRFDAYMEEMGGFTQLECGTFINACRETILFQLIYFPQQPYLSLSTLISNFCLYLKMRRIKPSLERVLEIGPGCGYLSFFLKDHINLEDYSQIEACESFYLLQNLVNVYCFKHYFDEQAFPIKQDHSYSQDPEIETPNWICVNRHFQCYHYPWWQIDKVTRKRYQIVTSNASLLEFSPVALDNYLSLIHQVLEPGGYFLVQCLGYPARGETNYLFEKLQSKGFIIITTANLATTNLLLTTQLDNKIDYSALAEKVFYPKPEGRIKYLKEYFVKAIEAVF